MKYKTYIVISLLLITAFMAIYIISILSTNVNKMIQPYEHKTNENMLDLVYTLSNIKQSDIKVKFPYKEYLNSNNFLDIKLLKNDIELMDSLYTGDEIKNMTIISITLTDSLFEKIKLSFNTFNFHLILNLFQWSERFKFYSEVDQTNSNLYLSIYDFWMNFISNSLAKYSNIDSKLKYNFYYKYLEAKCNENRYFVATRVNPIEKVIYNLTGNHWSHLFSATWNQTSILQKILAIIFIILTLISYFYATKYLFRNN